MIELPKFLPLPLSTPSPPHTVFCMVFFFPNSDLSKIVLLNNMSTKASMTSVTWQHFMIQDSKAQLDSLYLLSGRHTWAGHETSCTAPVASGIVQVKQQWTYSVWNDCPLIGKLCSRSLKGSCNNSEVACGLLLPTSGCTSHCPTYVWENLTIVVKCDGIL